MAGPSVNNKIHQRGPFQLLEMFAGGTILPGQLLMQTNAGTPQVVVHNTAGGFAEKMFAQEDALQGNIDSTTYGLVGANSTGPDPVSIVVETSGNLVLANLLAGYNYTPGLFLISDGAGNLKPTTGSPNQIIAVVTAPGINLSASHAVNTLSQVRIL